MTQIAAVTFDRWSDKWEDRLEGLSDPEIEIYLYRPRSSVETEFEIPDGVHQRTIGPSRRVPLLPVNFATLFLLFICDYLIGRTNYQAVHSFDYYFGPVFATLAGTLIGAPSLVSIRGLPKQITDEYREEAIQARSLTSILFHYLMIAAYFFIGKSSTQLLFKSTASLETFQNLCGESIAEKSRVIPTGVNPDKFTDPPKPESKIIDEIQQADGDSVLYAGRIAEGKGVEELIDLHRSINFDASLHIVGTASDQLGKQLVNELRNSNYENVQFHPGLVPHSEMSILLREVDVVVLLSNYSSEGTPRIIQEALFVGTPCLVSDTPGVYEEFEDLEGCFVINPREILEYETKLRAALSSDVDVKTVRRRFNMWDNYDEIRRLYKRIPS